MKKPSIILLLALLLCILLSACDKITTKEPSDYATYYGAGTEQRQNTMLTIDIFPEKIPESAQVEVFRYEYYNPFDPNYTGVLVYSCDEADYAAEIERLSEIGVQDDMGIYGVTSFPYEICAFRTNEYGIVYAMTDETNRTLIYGEILFCNYFSDSNYKSIIGEKYLPIGFDAVKGNATRKAFEKRLE